MIFKSLPPRALSLSAYYWRTQRDYDDVPDPRILYFDPDKDSLDDIKNAILAEGNDSPRIVLHGRFGDYRDVSDKDLQRRAMLWAEDSVGMWEQPFSKEKKRYGPLPSLKKLGRDVPYAVDVFAGLRNCMNIFGRPKGNRTCFQICD